MQPDVDIEKSDKENEPLLDGAAQGKAQRSSLVSRNLTVGAHRTSVRLEPDMWAGLREICRREHVSIHDVATLISDRKAENTSLTAAVRVFIMTYFRAAATEEGHSRAGHGPGGPFMAALVAKRLEEQCLVPEQNAQSMVFRYTSGR